MTYADRPSFVGFEVGGRSCANFLALRQALSEPSLNQWQQNMIGIELPRIW